MPASVHVDIEVTARIPYTFRGIEFPRKPSGHDWEAVWAPVIERLAVLSQDELMEESGDRMILDMSTAEIKEIAVVDPWPEGLKQ